jgi:predicted amidohydrolase YtcJ
VSRSTQLLFVLPWLLGACGSNPDRGAPAAPSGPADLVIHHAKVITVDPGFSVREALAVKAGRIVALGDDLEVLRWAGPETRVVDAEGYVVLPGLYDSHVHITSAAWSELSEPLPELTSLEDAFTYIRRKAQSIPEGQWIELRFAFATRLKEARFPTRAELDAAAPRHPVRYNMGPADLVNTKALEMSGITRDTRHPGVVRDPSTGEPTGLLRNAGELLKMPPAGGPRATPEEKREAVKRLLALYNAQGLTSVADRDASPEDLRLFLDLERTGELTCRINVAREFDPRGSREEVIRKLEELPGPDRRGGPTGVGDDWVRIGPIKLYTDGGMLLGTAYMREPWPKGPTYQTLEDDWRGQLKIEPPQLELVLEEAARRGWQMTSHTAGEAAMDVLLDAYEAVNRRISIQGKRWCITHANFPSPRNLERCRRLGVCADVQPAWLYKDGTSLLHLLGAKRLRWFQPYKSWLEYTTIGGGSDHMVKTDSLKATNPWNPWLGIWTTITRKTEQGTVLFPEEKLSREQAIRLYTWNNAYLHHEENEKGSLEVGKLADLIIVDRDVLDCTEDDLRRTRVLYTVIGGKVVYERGR